jgi:flagellar motor switch protein FliG
MAAPAHPSVLSGIQKAAILLISVGDQASAELLKRLSDDEVQAVTAAIASLPAISREQAETVLEEFRSATSVAGQGHGGVDFARRILTSAFGAEGSKKHVERLPKAAGRSSDAGQRLQKLDPQLLARFVESEHPQTIALVLAHLSAGQSAAVLRSMPAELRAEVTIRLASLDQISPVVIKISAVISKKLQTLGEVKRESSGGLRAVAEIFNQLDGELSSEILGQVGERDSGLVESIRQQMFVFDDLMMIDAGGIKELLGRADRRQLTIALKGTGDELRKHLLQGMSQRGAAMLMEDMEALGPVKIREVEEAQQMMIALLRQLETEGVVNLKGGGDEQYIV